MTASRLSFLMLCCGQRRYFVGLLHLCSEICLGRNKSAITDVAATFPLDTIMQLLSDDSVMSFVSAHQQHFTTCLHRTCACVTPLPCVVDTQAQHKSRNPYAVRAALCKLLCNAFVDCEPHQEIRFPQLTRVCCKYNGQIPCSPHAAAFAEMKAFVATYFTRLRAVMKTWEV